MLFKERKLVEKVKSMYEVNIDFNVWADNVFKIKCSTDKILELINPGKSSSFVDQISE